MNVSKKKQKLLGKPTESIKDNKGDNGNRNNKKKIEVDDDIKGIIIIITINNDNGNDHSWTMSNNWSKFEHWTTIQNQVKCQLTSKIKTKKIKGKNFFILPVEFIFFVVYFSTISNEEKTWWLPKRQKQEFLNNLLFIFIINHQTIKQRWISLSNKWKGWLIFFSFVVEQSTFF